MRVALVSNILPPHGRGGAEAYVAQLGSELASAGHEVLVLSGSPGDVEGAEIRLLPSLGQLDPSTPRPGKLLWHARDQWLPSVYVALSRELKRFRPDVVHTHECQGLSAAVFSAIERPPRGKNHFGRSPSVVPSREPRPAASSTIASSLRLLWA